MASRFAPVIQESEIFSIPIVTSEIVLPAQPGCPRRGSGLGPLMSGVRAAIDFGQTKLG
jgi:hypothetical protein